MKRRIRYFLSLCAGAALSVVMAAGAVQACSSYMWSKDKEGYLRCTYSGTNAEGCQYNCSCAGTCGPALYRALRLNVPG